MRGHPGMRPGTRGKQAMNKIAAAMAAGAATFALISAPLAHADIGNPEVDAQDRQFAAVVHAAGIPGDPTALGTIATAVCSVHIGGMSSGDATELLRDMSPADYTLLASWTPARRATFGNLADAYICPK
jgi:hypothetical protein